MLSSDDVSGSRARRDAGQGAGDARPPGTGAVRAALLAAAAALAAATAWSAWVGTRFALAGLSAPPVAVRGEVGSAVRLLSALLEGGSGPLLLAAASALIAAAGAGVGPAAEGPAAEAVRARLARLRGDLDRLSADAARWLRELPRRRGGWHAAALGAVVLGGVALRALYLSGPVRYDEAFTFVHFADRPAALGISRYTYPNNHLLHTLLVHLATSAFGSGPALMRLPAFAAGAAVVPAAYAAWDALGDADEALVASAVAAVAAPLVLYSVNARGYALVALCSLLLVPPAARLRRRRDLAAWGVVCAVAVAGLYAIPVALYPVGGVLAWLVVSPRGGAGGPEPGEGSGAGPGPGRAARSRPSRALEAGVALAVVAVAVGWLYLPAVQRSGVPALVANRFVQAEPVGEFVAALPGFFRSVWSTWTAGWPAAAAATLGVLAAAGLARDAGRLVPAGSRASPERRAAAAYPLVLLAWSLLVLAATRRASFARLWLFLLPVFGLQVARGLSLAAGWLRRRSEDAAPAASRVLGPAAAVLLLAGLGGSVAATDAVVESPATGPYRDGEEAARLLRERMGPGDSVLAFGPAEVVMRYWHRQLDLPGKGVNAPPEAGGTIFLVVDRSEGQRLADLMAKLGVAGSDRLRTREVAELEGSTLYALLPSE